MLPSIAVNLKWVKSKKAKVGIFLKVFADKTRLKSFFRGMLPLMAVNMKQVKREKQKL